MIELDLPVELVWDTRCVTGESCTWDERNGRVLFCDIPAGVIHSYTVATGAKESWQLPELVASFGICRSGRLVVALRARIVLFDTRTGAVTELAGPVDQPPTVRLNDGKVGPDGCFWVGGIDQSPERSDHAALWRVTPGGRAERKATGYRTCNGLAWSPDGTVMFHTDTRIGALDAWDFSPNTGGIGNRRRLATLTDAEGRPDGGATDAGGCYWSAGISAGYLNRFSPGGTLLARQKLPVPAPTMPCFAGDWIYLTTLRENRPAEQLAAHPTMGGLFRMPAPVRGAPVAQFADS
jgi:sugar lactone lactonase YvrE